MNTPREKVSYCIGLETGRSLRSQFAEIDFNLVQQGFTDAFSDGSPKLANEEVKTIMAALRRQIEQQQKEFFIKLAEHNKKEGETFLSQNKIKEGVITLPSGLQYRVIEKKGSGPSPRSIDVVTAHLKGYFLDGRVFENTYENEGKPQTFPVNRVIPGWAEALQLMHVGEKWQIFVPHYLAYGEMGYGNEIGPNSTLVFEIELLGVQNQ